jgi:hypothetical protein
VNRAGVCCGGINNTGRSRGRKVRWAGRCDAVIRADGHSRHITLTRCKWTGRRRSSELAYQLRNPSCSSIITKSLLVFPLAGEWKEPKSLPLPLLLISFSQVPLTPHPGVLDSTSSLRCRHFPGALLASFSLSLSDQKGMQLLIRPEVSAGYPSIFLPVSLAQQPQKIAAGQQMICTIVRIETSDWVQSVVRTARRTAMMKPRVGPTILTWHGFWS